MTTKTALYIVLAVGTASFVSICDVCKTPAQAATIAQVLQAQHPRTVTFAVRGMTCAGCVLSTRTVLTRLPGVTKADVSYEKGTAVVTYDPAKVTIAQMIAAIQTLKYTATVVTTATPKPSAASTY